MNGSIITFSFIGKFADNNNKQTFTVFYKNTSGVNTTWDATFTKIKSLLTANSFSQILPSPTSITAQRCQVQNFNISFSNVQYGNPWESPAIGYGTVTNYEYLLPVGWSLNSTTSTGSNWISGGNSVTVTSDLSNGIGSGIRIRPVNTQCGTGLIEGQEASIAISRPAPTLDISPFSQTICSGSANYTLSGVPAGASVSWSVSHPGEASVAAQSGNQNVAVVTRTGTADINATLTATVTHCSFTYNITARIVLGTPVPDDIIGMDISTHLTGGQYITLYINEPGSSYNWSVTGGTIIGSNTGQYVYAKLDNCSLGQVTLNEFSATISYQNACGSSNSKGETAYAECDGNSPPEDGISISPNPAKGDLYVEIKDENPEIKTLARKRSIKYELYDVYSKQVLRQWIFKNDLNKRTLNIRGIKKGIYVLQITRGNQVQSAKVVIE